MVNAVPVARVIKSLFQDDPSWDQFSTWTCDLLLQKTMESARHPLTAGDCLRRFFSALSVGLVLQHGHGIADVTNDNANYVAELRKQEREDITGKAQLALRLIAFGYIHKLLDIPKVANRQKGESKPLESRTKTEETLPTSVSASK